MARVFIFVAGTLKLLSMVIIATMARTLRGKIVKAMAIGMAASAARKAYGKGKRTMRRKLFTVPKRTIRRFVRRYQQAGGSDESLAQGQQYLQGRETLPAIANNQAGGSVDYAAAFEPLIGDGMRGAAGVMALDRGLAESAAIPRHVGGRRRYKKKTRRSLKAKGSRKAKKAKRSRKGRRGGGLSYASVADPSTILTTRAEVQAAGLSPGWADESSVNPAFEGFRF
jgi:hypothetical protein